jgi:hypothetical protein
MLHPASVVKNIVLVHGAFCRGRRRIMPATALTLRSATRTANTWLLQEVTTRLPGRIDPGETSFASANDLASALRRAEAAHGEHEKRAGKREENWPRVVCCVHSGEQAGKELPQ